MVAHTTLLEISCTGSFSHLPTKPYNVGTQTNRLNEAVPLNTPIFFRVMDKTIIAIICTFNYSSGPIHFTYLRKYQERALTKYTSLINGSRSRKPVFGVSDQVIPNAACSVTETI